MAPGVSEGRLRKGRPEWLWLWRLHLLRRKGAWARPQVPQAPCVRGV